MSVTVNPGARLVQRIFTKIDTGEFVSSLTNIVLTLAKSATNRAFAEGKDPVTGSQWAPSKKLFFRSPYADPGPTMLITGRLRRSVRYRAKITKLQAEILGFSDLVYASVHQSGAVYPGVWHPGSRKRQFILASKRWVYYTVAHYIQVPRRRFIGIGRDEREEVRKRLRMLLHE